MDDSDIDYDDSDNYGDWTQPTHEYSRNGNADGLNEL